MSNRTITHEIKLEKSVKIIIGIFAIGVFLNVFSPLLETKSALAKKGTGSTAYPFHIICDSGCNWLYLVFQTDQREERKEEGARGWWVGVS